MFHLIKFDIFAVESSLRIRQNLHLMYATLSQPELTPWRSTVNSNCLKSNRYILRPSKSYLMREYDSRFQRINGLLSNCSLVVRIRCDAKIAQCPLGFKFGCDPISEAPRLLKQARMLGLNVRSKLFCKCNRFVHEVWQRLVLKCHYRHIV